MEHSTPRKKGGMDASWVWCIILRFISFLLKRILCNYACIAGNLSGTPGGQKKAWHPGARITDSCGYWEMNLGFLEEYQVLLTIDTLVQPISY